MNRPMLISVGDEVAQLLSRWEVLSGSEAEAIENEDWTALAQAQSTKRQLQTRLDALLDSSHPRLGLQRVMGRGYAVALDEQIAKLKAQERSNSQMLERKLSLIRSRMAELEVCTRHLQQVQRAYGTGAVSGWQWYS